MLMCIVISWSIGRELRIVGLCLAKLLAIVAVGIVVGRAEGLIRLRLLRGCEWETQSARWESGSLLTTGTSKLNCRIRLEQRTRTVRTM